MAKAIESREIIMDSEGYWKCICGNDTDSDGFFPCTESGKQIEPTVGSGWTTLYVCGECDRIIDSDTMRVVARISPEIRWRRGVVSELRNVLDSSSSSVDVQNNVEKLITRYETELGIGGD